MDPTYTLGLPCHTIFLIFSFEVVKKHVILTMIGSVDILLDHVVLLPLNLLKFLLLLLLVPGFDPLHLLLVLDLGVVGESSSTL